MAGLGAIGRLHSEHVLQLANARLARVTDADARLADRAAAELGVRSARSYEELLSDPAVQAVVIATPTPLHAGMVEQAAAAGRHVFCEKPLSLDVATGRAAIRAAARAGIRLQVGFQRRFDRGLVALKASVDAGGAGEPRLLRISHRNRTPPHPGELAGRLGSTFVDMTIHDFDTARWLVGELGVLAAFEGGGASVVIGRFEQGALAVIDNTRAARYGFECSVELMGTSATLRTRSGTGGEVERLTPAGRVVPLSADNVDHHRDAYLAELRHFVECVRHGAEPAVGGGDSVAALELSLAAERCVA